ncbi:GNAT family N-acetyltransferase [Flexibacterium corallicola]|uniref:GNAT family N-acetyltransferase n=1 Tax=Flexibacterium corallicola TaxID=3037259 RepID=UPI00286F3B01|nr:GNAT family N-acetyltransferase [Pseudovibrio sp. M1P-2-3]
MGLSIKIEDPLQKDVVALVERLTDELHELTPADACHHLTPEQMKEAGTTVFVARNDGVAVACGALKVHSSAVGEVKRMFTSRQARGLGAGRKILNEITALAKEKGLSELVLETGWNYEAALHLYESEGFTRCGPILDYPEHPESVFYVKPLAATVEI